MRVLAALFVVLLLISTSVCRAQENPSGLHQLRLVQQLQQPQKQNDMRWSRRPERLKERPSTVPPAARRRAPLLPGPTISTPSQLSAGTVGQFYRQPLAATGGKGPYEFKLDSGKLPAGLGIAGNSIVGTPIGLGSTFVVRVIDSNKLSSTKRFSLAIRKPPAFQKTPPVAVAPLQIVTPSPLPLGTVGILYTQSLVASGGKPPYLFSLATGDLPLGLKLEGNGTIDSTPWKANTWNFGVKVTDDALQTATKSFSLTINTQPTIVTPSPLPSGTVGKSYSQKFVAEGGVEPYTFFSVVLPPGLQLNGEVLEGTPTGAGLMTFKIGVKDFAQVQSIKTFHFDVYSTPVITTPDSPPDGHVGVGYNLTFEAEGGKEPYGFSLANGALPDGLTLSGNTLSGKPKAAGKASFVLTVTDDNKNSNIKTFSITITEAPEIATASPLPSGTVGNPYVLKFAAELGAPPYTFSLASGALPDGVTWTNLSSTNLSGVPTTTGVWSFVVKVIDQSGSFSTKSFSLKIGLDTDPLPATLKSGALKVVGVGAAIADPNAPPLPAIITSSPLKIVGPGQQ